MKANKLGFLLLLFSSVLYVDLKIVQYFDGLLHQALTVVFYILILVYLHTLLYIFPIFVHFNLNTIEYVKHAIILAIARPIQSLFMVIGITSVLLLLRFIPGLIPICSMSLLGFVLTKIATISFPKRTNLIMRGEANQPN